MLPMLAMAVAGYLAHQRFGGGARDLSGELGARGGPQPEGTVDVHPRALRMRPVDQRAERVAGPAVHVASLEAHDRRAVQVGQVRWNDAPLTIGGQPQRPAPAEPDQAQGLEHRGVAQTAHRLLEVRDGGVRQCASLGPGV